MIFQMADRPLCVESLAACDPPGALRQLLRLVAPDSLGQQAPVDPPSPLSSTSLTGLHRDTAFILEALKKLFHEAMRGTHGCGS